MKISPEIPLNKKQLKIIYFVSRVIKALRRYLPWECTCLTQAIAAKFILKLKKIPTTLYLGLKKEGNELAAHAWVRSGDIIITGGNGLEKQFTIVSTFT